MQIMAMMLVMAVSCINAMEQEIKVPVTQTQKSETVSDAKPTRAQELLRNLLTFRQGRYEDEYPTSIQLRHNRMSPGRPRTPVHYYLKLIHDRQGLMPDYWQETVAANGICSSSRQPSYDSAYTTDDSGYVTCARSVKADTAEQAKFNATVLHFLCDQQIQSGVIFHKVSDLSDKVNGVLERYQEISVQQVAADVKKQEQIAAARSGCCALS